jgi:hypothetical protein
MMEWFTGDAFISETGTEEWFTGDAYISETEAAGAIEGDIIQTLPQWAA